VAADKAAAEKAHAEKAAAEKAEAEKVAADKAAAEKAHAEKAAAEKAEAEKVQLTAAEEARKEEEESDLLGKKNEEWMVYQQQMMALYKYERDTTKSLTNFQDVAAAGKAGEEGYYVIIQLSPAANGDKLKTPQNQKLKVQIGVPMNEFRFLNKDGELVTGSPPPSAEKPYAVYENNLTLSGTDYQTCLGRLRRSRDGRLLERPGASPGQPHHLWLCKPNEW